MAEGDSVFRMARRIESAFDGRAVESAEAPNPRSSLRNSAARLTGSSLVGLETRGKHLLLHFSDDLSVHAHMGMGGSWHVHRTGQRPRRPRSAAWLVLVLGPGNHPGPDGPDGSDHLEVLQFGGPTLRLARRAELDRDPRLARLGPDLLDPGFSVALAARRLAATGPVEIGEAVLDQKVVSGIGNIFKSEACFEAAIDPWRPAGSLGLEELETLVTVATNQLRHGAETGRRPGRVYRKAGRPCPRCGGRIRSRGQGLDNRITYWCPECQR